MKKIKQYLTEVKEDESGMEILQFAIVLVATVALIGVVMAMKDTIANYITRAGDQVDDQFNNALQSEPTNP